MNLLARLPLAVTGWIALLCASLAAGAAPLRISVVGLFLLFGPGTAALRPLRPALRGLRAESAGGAGVGAGAGGGDPDGAEDRPGTVTAQNLLLTVLLSLSALVLMSTALMLSGAFSGLATLALLAAFTTVCALCPPLPAGRGARADAE